MKKLSKKNMRITYYQGGTPKDLQSIVSMEVS